MARPAPVTTARSTEQRDITWSTTQREDLLSARGQDLYDDDGQKIGSIEEIYLDAESDEPEWALVNTGLFGTKSSFVPLRGAREQDGSLQVPYDKAQVKDAPKLEADGRLSPQEEEQLYRHYGIGSGDSSSDREVSGDAESTRGNGDGNDESRRTAGGDRGTTGDAMTRSEEELRVGTTERESGRVRLKKYVVEDEVTQTVPVRREEVHVEREPITDANVGDATSGPEISEEEHEVVLHEEEAVVDKQVVPKERVRLDKDVTTDEEQVSETLRKEEVDVDQDVGRSSR